MKKTALSLLLLSFISVSCYAGTELKVGTYNVRYYNTDDKGLKAWSSRKSYVAQILIGHKYDIVGLNEVRTTTQQKDLHTLMKGYDYVEYEDGKKHNWNSIYFLQDKFEVLESGYYFLSVDGNAKTYWDNSTNIRHTTWVKLKVKNTEEILYYFSTHLDQTGVMARQEQARINVEHVRKIAGNYPAIIAGDHNCTDGWTFIYDYYRSYLKDSYKVSASFEGLEKGAGTMTNRTVEGVSKWDPDFHNSARIDFIWVKGVTVGTYSHFYDDYGRGETPSDHIPIQATVTLEDYKPIHHVMAEASFESLQSAINNTQQGDTVLVRQGKFTTTKPLTIDHSLVIIGGYNDDYSRQVGSTEIEGNKTSRILYVDTNAALELTNVDICKGQTSESSPDGAGIYCAGTRLVLNTCKIYDNHAVGNGAGVYAGGQLIIKNCQLYNNSAAKFGGAFYTKQTTSTIWWRYTIEGSEFHDNVASNGAAGYSGGYTQFYAGHNSFYDNVSSENGTVYIQHTSKDANARTIFTNNIFTKNKAQKGSAAYLQLNGLETSNISIINNTAVNNDGETAFDVNTSLETEVCNNIFGKNSGKDVLLSSPATVMTQKNIYSVASNINYSADASDLLCTTSEESTAAINEMLNADSIPGMMFVRTPSFKGVAINDLTTADLTESNLYSDINNNIEREGCMIYDRQYNIRRTNGACRGALEYIPASKEGEWNGFSTQHPKRDNNGNFIITCAQELAWVSAESQNVSFNDNLIFDDDIDMCNKSWVPIGSKATTANNYWFCGNVEGNGHTIKNLYMTSDSKNAYYGLFGTTGGQTQTISGLNIEGTLDVVNTDNSSNVDYGSFIGYAYHLGKIVNCHSKFKINVGAGVQVNNIGGLICRMADVSVEQCSFDGTIMVSEQAKIAQSLGGIVASSNLSKSGVATISDCWFSGNIINRSNSATNYVAAIIAFPNMTMGTQNIRNCYAAGTIQMTTTHLNYGVIYGKKASMKLLAENNYSVGLSAVTSDGAIMATEQQLHNGNLCWLLNCDQTSVAFGQDLTDGESIPVNYVDGMQVYRHLFIVCDTAYSSRFYNTDMFSVFPAAPVIEDNKFLGWFDSQEGGEQYFENTPVSDDMILYAHFENPTGVTPVSLSPALSTREGAIYNLQGIKVSSIHHGQLYIRGGKKYLKK